MKIDGNLIASEIKEDLKKKIAVLASKNIYPQLAVIIIGDDPSSKIYVGRKQKTGKEIGVKVQVYDFPSQINIEKIIGLTKKLNRDKRVHGIIIQRPLPLNISKEELDSMVDPKKDVDGFHPNSLFNPPVALAVYKILKWIQSQYHTTVYSIEIKKNNINLWLKKQKILVIGRGETAGKPVADYFTKLRIPIQVAHSQTLNLKTTCLKSDIIISCVGLNKIVRHDMVTNKTILIGVGLHLENGKLATDYNQEEIAGKVAFYTPVPGGVGPVNVTCLFFNLLKAVSI